MLVTFQTSQDRVRFCLVLGYALIAIPSAQAQVPSAGSFQQNIDQELRQNPLPQKAAPKLIPEPEKKATGGISFVLKAVKFTGNTVLSNSQIESLIEPYLNKLIDFGQLQVLASAIEVAYRNSGAIARVVIPPQDINNGVLTIQIEESIFGITKIEGAITRVKPQQIIDIMNAAQTSGQLVEVSRLDRGILLSDDLPGVTVGGVLAQGSTALTTDLIARVADEPLVFGNAQADNTGPTSIGAYRVLGNLGINSPLGVGDLLSATYLYSEGSNYGRLSYTVPVGNDGVRVGVNASTLDYKLVSGSFASYGGFGTAQTAGLEANYPLIRSRTANLYVGANADYRQFSNSYSGTLVSQYNVMDYSATVYGNSFDSLAGGGGNQGSLTLVTGSVNLDGSPSQSYVANSTGAQGSFTKLRYSAARTQNIIDDLSLFASLTGQATNQNLDSSEMFYLGGAYGVRAYPTNEGAGSQGQLATVELRQKFPENVVAALFYDYGHVQQNANNSINGASTINSYAMKGAGLSLGWKPASNIDLKTIWAKRIGANPNPTSIGGYQDGTNGSSQFWFMGSIAF
ncbi:hypothetical protein CBI30_10845 [Polynucleobacter aenigmaticus]|uniref:POTRA domain-containing protein n=1 Tax=Polynucleobacter aenigmaticus TaxID=1743164 RepID=A0A254PR44_9BURK|nr:ShlB/FhaC/HecB family hemolysin secretion/activation protein [Polynucleobacter aenigmaticus]OWS69015.1 hypothetical protein CBI30_10845 [Polynucleobacter aenigmaticus]